MLADQSAASEEESWNKKCTIANVKQAGLVAKTQIQQHGMHGRPWKYLLQQSMFIAACEGIDLHTD
jgi:hypothetical protein